MQKEIERTIKNRTRSHDIALALSIGSAAIDEERPDVAVEVLAWAKSEAPRISAIREAYGVALYLADDFAAALSELQAYRRLTGKNDQNHLIADCLRALERDVTRIAEVAEAAIDDEQVAAERRSEAAIVWAAAVADTGDIAGGRAILRRWTDRHEPGGDQQGLRLRYLAGDLAERAGDLAEARRQFARINDRDPGMLDVGERLVALERDGGA